MVILLRYYFDKNGTDVRVVIKCFHSFNSSSFYYFKCILFVYMYVYMRGPLRKLVILTNVITFYK